MRVYAEEYALALPVEDSHDGLSTYDAIKHATRHKAALQKVIKERHDLIRTTPPTLAA